MCSRLTASLAAEPDIHVGPVSDRGRRQCLARTGAHCVCPHLRPGLRLVARPDNEGFRGRRQCRLASRAEPLASRPQSRCGSRERVPRPGLRANRPYEADPDGPPGIVGFGLRNPDGSPQGSRRGLPHPCPDHLGAVHTALPQEIPGRLANSSGPGRLGDRRMHARQLQDDRRRSAEWTRISSFITRKSLSATPPSNWGGGGI